MKTGVLLINLGTPDSPSAKDVRKYLTQFLNDPLVIDINPIVRFLLVNLIIVPFRTPKSAKLYKLIWTKEGSPLLVHGNKVKKMLQQEMGEKYLIELGMRYQNPSIESALESLRKQQTQKIIVIPLYPQYASSSTGSTTEEVMRVIKKWEVIPEVKFIDKFYDRSDFIDAFVETAKKYNLNNYDYFLFSYHNLPERHIYKDAAQHGSATCNLGDCCNSINKNNAYCYRAACFETTRQIARKLNISKEKYETTFQSRLNYKWMKPFSDTVVAEKAKAGIKRMLVFSPAFVADCLETIYEIGKEYKDIFIENGGQELQLAESLNDNPAWINVLKNMVLES